jgi:SAM-dependent methyltransferase
METARMGLAATNQESSDQTEASRYSHILYPSHPYAETHPDRLAVIGLLFGAYPPAVESCRVLEIGCGDGANLIPIALSLPHSECVGIDLAPVPVQTARSLIAQLGIGNVRCEIMDLLEASPELGTFDYIIAHGFYSWVPPAVREKLLAFCADSLSPNGIAFVSYNAYPGGHIRQASREMMLFHNAHNKGADNPVRLGVEFLQFLLDSMGADSLWKTIVRSEVERLAARDPNALYHDDLGTVCTPFYFADFVHSASQHGLQFLSEAMLDDMIAPRTEPKILQRLEQLAGEDVIAQQQYLDFLLNRSFRRTLLCRNNVTVDRKNLLAAINRLSVASSLRKTGKHSSTGYEFSGTLGGGSYTTKNDIMLATLAHLEAIWPQAEPFPMLLEHTLKNIAGSLHGVAEENLAPNILNMAAHSLVELRSHRPALVQKLSARPIASPLARLQSAKGPRVTTILHYETDIPDERVRWLIQMLDGSRDRAVLTSDLVTRYPDLARKNAEEQLDGMLRALYRIGVLVG